MPVGDHGLRLKKPCTAVAAGGVLDLLDPSNELSPRLVSDVSAVQTSTTDPGSSGGSSVCSAC